MGNTPDGLGYSWSFGFVPTGRPIASFTGHVGAVLCVAWSPRGDRLASAGDDESILLWNVETRRHTTLTGHDGHVAALAWSPDGKWLASGSEDGSVKLWDPGTGSLRQTLSAGSHVTAVCWSGDGSRIFACGRRDMTIAWDFASGGELWNNVIQSGYELNSITCSPNGRELAVGGMRNSIDLLDPATGKTLIPLFGDPNAVLSIAWSPDGRRLASASTDGTVKIWDALSRNTSKHTLRQPDQAKTLAWSPDGTQLAVAGRRSFPWIRDFTRNGIPVAMDAGFTPVTLAVAWNQEGSRLASAGGNGLAVFDTATRLPAWQVPATSPRSPAASRGIPQGHASPQSGMACSHSGTPQAENPVNPSKLPAGTTGALAWSPDGRKAVQFAELANQVTGGRQAGVLFILAAAYAETGDFEKAVATQKKSTSLLSRTGEAQPTMPPHSNFTRPASPSAMTRGRFHAFLA